MKKYLFLACFIFISCAQKEEVVYMNKNSEINNTDIKKLATTKIYFGHQSVGYNIIDAIKLKIPNASGLNIIETDDPESFNKPVFAHSKNGENFKPETKIAAFVNKMNSGIGDKVDVAFFKFCYVDITSDTDVNKLFNEYKKSMDSLKKKYPKTLFLHITVPLTSENSIGIKNIIKSFIKTLLGKTSRNVYDNIQRMRFNMLLKNEFGDSVFDLSAIESTDTSGEMILSNKGGIKHPTLLHQYTNDGGHLNEDGSRLVSSGFLKFIAKQL